MRRNVNLSEFRKKIERWFEAFGHIIYRRRWIAIVIMVLLVAGLGSQIPKLTVDTSNEGFLHENDPTLIQYNAFRDRFGRDEFIIIAIEPDDVFSLKTLNKIKALHEEIESEVPHLDEIISMVNARNTRGEGDRLIVEDLLEDWPQTPEDLETLKQRVLSNPLYLNRLISKDGRFTTIVVRTDTYTSEGAAKDMDSVLEGFEEDTSAGTSVDKTLDGFDDQSKEAPAPQYLTDKENTAVVETLEHILEKYDSNDFKLFLSGTPVTTHVIKKSMLSDMSVFVRLVILTIALCLLIMFRRLTGVVLPLLIVATALVSTLGLMAIFGIHIKLPTTILPSFILAVGVGASVHVLAMYYQELNRTGRREQAICHALGHSGLAIVMTSLTTAAGLASFATADIAPLADLGTFAAIGVMLALIYTIILLPAFLAVIPAKVKKPLREGGPGRNFNRMLTAIADFSTSHPKAITAVTIVIIAVSLAGTTRLYFRHDPLKWLPEETSIRQDTLKIDHELRGTVAMEMLVDTGKENGLYDVEVLNKLDRITAELETQKWDRIFIGKATSVADMLKEIHKALNENQAGFYKIPQDPALIPQEFLLFENSGSDDLQDVVDTRFQIARVTLKGPWEDSNLYVTIIDEIEAQFQETFADSIIVTTTGMLPLLARTVYASIRSAVKSYIMAGVVITLMMIILIGSVRLGLLSMIPNLLPIIITLGIMGWANFPFDMFTMLIGSIAIGLAVDDTVHFMHNFRRYQYETADVAESVRLTLTTTGRAMLVTSVVLSIGFFIYMFASMHNLFNFGLLTGITIITALLADYFVAPALMALVHRK
jgi:predicted RND superfamily exporter protein